MLTLNLGVVDVPYTYGDEARSTGDVAGYLERKYGVMAKFYEMSADAVAKDLEASVVGALDSLYLGAPSGGVQPFAAAGTAIEAKFRAFLDRDAMASLGVPGVPTRAALEGVNHRKKSKKGEPRVSFVDTGLYGASFRAWVE